MKWWEEGKYIIAILVIVGVVVLAAMGIVQGTEAIGVLIGLAGGAGLAAGGKKTIVGLALVALPFMGCAGLQTGAAMATPVVKEVGECTFKCAVGCLKKACKSKLKLGEQCDLLP